MKHKIIKSRATSDLTPTPDSFDKVGTPQTSAKPPISKDADLMTPEHPNWHDFLDRLEGPDGCNFHNRTPGNPDTLTWTCDSGDTSCPIARRLLADMGFTDAAIDCSIMFFHSEGGFCDCEIVLNVGWGGAEESRE
jgi:hypothetical protein